MADKFLVFSALILTALAVASGPIFASPDLTAGQPVLTKGGRIYLGGLPEVRGSFVASRKDFLEVNVPEMKVKIYRSGSLIDSVSVVKAKVGLASGLFYAKSKKDIIYSLDSGAYFPYAVNYYASCYLHGEPYRFEDSKKVFFGGEECIRMENRNAKLVYEAIENGDPVLVIGSDPGCDFPEEKSVSPFPKISASGFLVADLDSGYIIAQRNSEASFPIASLTKLMTALVVEEQADLKKTIVVRSDMLKPYGATRGLAAGARYALEQLFYPLLRESSNDAAEILSGFLGRGNTIAAMNERAGSLLMEKTYFADAHGISSANTSSARDLFYLARYVADNHQEIFDITKGVNPVGFSSCVFPNLANKNFFSRYPNFIGGKTGYITESNYNGVFLFNLPVAGEKERKVAIILLGAPHWQSGYGNLKDDAVGVLAWLYQNYLIRS
jgi:hypothetical protein